MSRISDLLTLKRRLGTAFLLMTFGRAEVSRQPHEPLPDLMRPGLCGLDGIELGDPLHGRRRKARRTDLTAGRGGP